MVYGEDRGFLRFLWKSSLEQHGLIQAVALDPRDGSILVVTRGRKEVDEHGEALVTGSCYRAQHGGGRSEDFWGGHPGGSTSFGC